MNVSADQVRAATRVAAAVITADEVPPLRLDEAPGSHGLARRPRPAWVAPLAAAAAVVIVVVGSVAAGSWLARSGNGQRFSPWAGRSVRSHDEPLDDDHANIRSVAPNLHRPAER